MRNCRFPYRRFLWSFLLAFAVTATIAGCAAKLPGRNVSPPAGGLSGTWVFRHAATLEFPGPDHTLPFTGVMRLDAGARQARAVILSGMGMTLLDLQVDAMGHTVGFMHPSLLKMPHAAENTAAVIRFLWLGKILPGTAQLNCATASSEGFRAGWAEKITLEGDGFVLRITLVSSHRESE